MPSVNIESLEDYKKIISASDRCPLIVCFYTNWSVECQKILPEFERYSESDDNKGAGTGIRFYKVDCDDQPIASLYPGGPADFRGQGNAYEVSGSGDLLDPQIPAFLIYQHGRKVDEEFGSLSRGLQNLLKRNSPRLQQMVHRPPIGMVHYDDVHLLHQSSNNS